MFKFYKISIFLILFFSVTPFSFSNPTENLSLFITEVDDFMKKWVKEGKVNYAAIKKNPEEINALYAQIGKISLTETKGEEGKAFYINAYNIIVIHQVVQLYPIQSPMNQNGFFTGNKHLVAGEKLTLNQLEFKKLVIPFKDPRIHFSIACAAKGCPKLASYAYNPEKLTDQLEERVKKAVNDSEFTRVSSKEEKVQLSKIFSWYKKEFEESHGDILTFINDYRKTKIPESFELGFYEYNWELNSK
ncbi:DUF547 domain-containing protein [Flexithrix dorotheae]|uniref:DUF547 domain-containing protein n=1 Tax=Flexithrix dorotheae TaxID=70993 RepID=UPI0003735D92|nr:DUF547 domain-containing protein [Flexithrix dorotheae]